MTGWAPGGVGFGTVRAMAVRATGPAKRLVYIGGDFSQVAGQSRRKLAAVDADTGALDPWDPGVDGSAGLRIGSILSVGSDIVVGGPFQSIHGALRTGLALLSPEAPATVRDFDAGLDGGVDALASGSTATGAKLVVGGSFGRAGTRAQANLAIFPRQADVATSGAAVSRTGRWSARVRCPRGTAGGCRVTARLRELATARRGVIASVALRIPAGRVARVGFPISRAGRALLAGRGRLPSRLEISSRDRLGNLTATRRVVVLTGGR